MTTMTKRGAVLCMLAAVTMSAPAAAQDEEGARGAVDRLFEGMRTADPELVRSVLATDARFAMLDERNGPAAVRVQSVDGWVNAIGASAGSWDERVYDLDVRVDGNMASIWAPYTFYLDGEISHCGINSIELLHDADGWKITQISDTRRSESCPNRRD